MTGASKRPIRGLYAITPDDPDTARLTAMVERAVMGGASMVQYRNKAADATLRREQSVALLRVCRAHGVPLLVNDDVDLALAIDADGVHLGRDDGSLRSARERLSSDKILGASCYDQLQAAIVAQSAGATYVAFGSFFRSNIKPHAVSPGLQLLHEAKKSLLVPVVAIGGITVSNAPQLVAAGADAVAVISALIAADDIAGTARQFARLFPAER